MRAASASRVAAPPAPPITSPRGTPALLVGVASGLGVDLGVARVLIMVVIAGLVLESGLAITRGPEVVVTTVVITSGRVVVAGLAVVGLVVTL